jgi:hypothetical protein
VEAGLVTEISPEGTVWWCTHCGRIAADKQGRMAALGWTNECTQNAVLVHENSMKLDENGRVVQAAPVEKSGSRKAPGKFAEIRIAPEKGHSGSN